VSHSRFFLWAALFFWFFPFCEYTRRYGDILLSVLVVLSVFLLFPSVPQFEPIDSDRWPGKGDHGFSFKLASDGAGSLLSGLR
jgi:hypothetical protein